MHLTDALELTSAPKLDDSGNMLVCSRSARTGTQLYRGDSVGRPDLPWAVGYRPPEEVFAADSLASYTAIPVTIEHPETFVDASNWKQHAIGETDGAIKDGDYIRVPFTVRHAAAIKTIKDGKAQISMGYSADLDWTSGVTDSGENYDFVMRNLKMNHLAVVDSARGGPALKIGDEGKKPMKTIVIDSVPYNTENLDGLEAAVKKVIDRAGAADAAVVVAQKALTDAEAKAATDLAAAEAKVTALDAEVATLKQAVEDAKVTPEQMRDAAKAFAAVIDAAAKIAPAFKVEDSMSEADIRKGVVLAKLGDSYATKTQPFFDAAFEIEADKVKDQQAPVTDALQRSFAAPTLVQNLGDAAKQAFDARKAMIDGFNKREEA